jgi:hypothetical protein
MNLPTGLAIRHYIFRLKARVAQSVEQLGYGLDNQEI